MICHVVILYMLSHNGNKKLQLLLFYIFFRYKLFWIWRSNPLVYCENIKFVSLYYILCLGRAFHCSENILLLKFNFFKTRRIYWLLYYFSKWLYLVGLKIKLSQACRVDLEKKQNDSEDVPNSMELFGSSFKTLFLWPLGQTNNNILYR